MIFQIIFLFTLCPSPKPKIENKTFFIFKSIFNFDVINTFKQDLQRTNWKDIEAFTDPNESYKAFLERFLLLYDKYFPIRKIKIKVKDLVCPWITNGIKKSSKKKQVKKAYSLWSNGNDSQGKLRNEFATLAKFKSELLTTWY